MALARLTPFLRPATAVTGLTMLLALAACGGSGNRAPVLQPVADLTVVANRTVTPFRVTATDIDSTLLYYTATYQLPGLGLAMPGMIPGMAINKFTGQITGSPTTPGNYTVTITVKDGDDASDSKSFNFEVIVESLTTQVASRLDGTTTVTEMVLTAADTSRAGTTAYCIRTDATAPKADDACFKSAGDGGRTLTVPLTAGAKVPRHYLFTKGENGNVLSGTVPSGPFTSATWDAVGISAKSVVGVQTTAGAFAIELEDSAAPASAANFLQYVDERFFDGTVFHRISSNFVIQGGGYLYDAAATPAYSIKLAGLRAAIPLEKTITTGLSNVKGTLAMARSSAPDSATSQFFINVVDNTALDSQNSSDGNGYAVFGRVISGLNNVEIGKSKSTIDTLLGTQVTASTILSGENSMPVGTPPSILFVLRMN